MSDGKRPDQAEWQWKRREVIIRDDYECQECGATGAWKGSAELEVHHIELVAVGGSNTLDNLKTLCSDCHRDVHSTNSDDRSYHCDSPMPERDNNTGRYTEEEEHSTETFTDALRTLGGAAGTQEIADKVGCLYDTAYKKLRRMEDDGTITSRKIANARLWQLPEDEITRNEDSDD
jgi:hypothetical protein